MVNQELYQKIQESTAHVASKAENSQYILSNPDLMPDFFKIVLSTSDKNHHKACWILEMILEKDLHLLFNYLDQFCETLPLYTNYSALRSISKICMFLSLHASLTEKQEKLLIESSYDWLIDPNGKVATKAYAIRTLYQMGKKNTEIHANLARILTDDYTKYSSAYKAVAREIMKKIA